MGTNLARVGWTREGSRPKRTRLPQSLWATVDTVWDSRSGRALRSSGGQEAAISGEEAREPPHDPPHDCDPPAAGLCRHQYDSGLAWACVAGHNQRVRRDRPGDEGEGDGKLRGQAGAAEEVMARGQKTNGVPEGPVKRACARRSPNRPKSPHPYPARREGGIL